MGTMFTLNTDSAAIDAMILTTVSPLISCACLGCPCDAFVAHPAERCAACRTGHHLCWRSRQSMGVWWPKR